jgi:uncharacterized protein (DUF1501 family)
MEPITTALVAAAVAGVTKVGEKAIVEAYTGLKDLLRGKFGAQSEVAKAVEAVEAKPDSAGRKATLAEELAAAKAEQDHELVEAARELLERLQAQPGGAQAIQIAIGSYNAQADRGGIASVHVSSFAPVPSALPRKDD